MFTINININAPDLTNSLLSLAMAIHDSKINVLPPEARPVQSVPVQQVVPQVAPIAPPMPLVPTAAPSYSFDDIARAGASLMQTPRASECQNLLAKYGVASLTELDPARYGEIAADLRALGAQI